MTARLGAGGAPSLFPAAVVTLSLALLEACVPSPLIRPEDPVFDQGRARLEASVAEMSERAKAHGPPGAAETLFLQAEAFYHYRFSLERPRTALSYVAQLGAAASDFAPLNVLAGSQGILELRLRAYDGAAQLYEALLERYPTSERAPRAMYRLAWAYRNTTTEGFPRDSDETFRALSARFAGTPEARLGVEAARVPWKSQDTATLLSILPGAGQIYVGERLNGVVRLGIALALAAVAIIPAVVLVQNRRFEWAPVVISTAGLVGLQVCYTSAYQDAQRAALQFNEREEAKFDATHPEGR